MPCPGKISTIEKPKAPKNESELKSFLGLINYYHRFIPQLSAKLYYLYNLLKTNVKFNWDDNCQKAFEESKNSLLRADILEYFDAKKPIVISDASSYGLGGLIAHIVKGEVKPISFTSFSLNAAQRKYLSHPAFGSISASLHDKKIPPIFIWKKFYDLHGPQASSRNFW